MNFKLKWDKYVLAVNFVVYQMDFHVQNSVIVLTIYW